MCSKAATGECGRKIFVEVAIELLPKRATGKQNQNDYNILRQHARPVTILY